jgi:hypothetical protein
MLEHQALSVKMHCTSQELINARTRYKGFQSEVIMAVSGPTAVLLQLCNDAFSIVTIQNAPGGKLYIGHSKQK